MLAFLRAFSHCEKRKRKVELEERCKLLRKRQRPIITRLSESQLVAGGASRDARRESGAPERRKKQKSEKKMEKEVSELLKKAFFLGFEITGEGWGAEMMYDEIMRKEGRLSETDMWVLVKKEAESDRGYKDPMEKAMAKLAPALLAQAQTLPERAKEFEKEVAESLRKAFFMGFEIGGEGWNAEMMRDKITRQELESGGGDMDVVLRKKAEAGRGYKEPMDAAVTKLAPALLAQLEALALRDIVKSGAGVTETKGVPTPSRAPRSL